MGDEKAQKPGMIALKSSRFGELEVPADSVIEFPHGLIGFPNANRFVMLEHKPPFSWLHSVDDPSLAFVVVDGFEFGPSYDVKPPYNNRECDFRQGDEFAILVIVTVRPDPKATTANLKAPLFVNLKNKRGAQVIFDDARYSTRFPLWADSDSAEGEDDGKKNK